MKKDSRRGWMRGPFLLSALLAGAVAMASPAAHAGELVSIAGECWIDGDGHFDPPLKVLPRAGSVEGQGAFSCTFSVNGGPLQTRTATLYMGEYTPAPEGVFSCSASVFTGLAVIVFDEPLPGGYDAVLDRFEATQEAVSFWHHGAFLSVGNIVGNHYVERVVTQFPSEAMGEYLATPEDPTQCLLGGLETVPFAGPAVATLNYVIDDSPLSAQQQAR